MFQKPAYFCLQTVSVNPMTRQILLILFLTFYFPDTIKPCDCKPLPSVSDAVKKSDLVISGKIIKTKFKHQLSQSKGYLDTLSHELEKTIYGPAIVNEYTILVTRTYKGNTTSDTIILRTRLDPVTDCGLLLKLNQDYIFYLYNIRAGSLFFDQNNVQTYTSSTCTRTREFDKTEETEIIKTGSR